MVAKDNKDQPGHKSEIIASAIAGVTTAVLAVIRTVRGEFYDDIKKIPEVKENLESVRKTLQAKWEEVNNISAMDKTQRATARRKYFDFVVKEKKKGGDGLVEILEKRGFRSKGFTGVTLGTLDRLNQLSHESRVQIVINAAITAAVAAGGTYMFFNNRHMRERLDNMEEKMHQPSNER